MRGKQNKPKQNGTGKPEAVCVPQGGEGELCSQLSLLPVLTLCVHRGEMRNTGIYLPMGTWGSSMGEVL